MDVAQKVQNGETFDVVMGHANVIWQGDANEQVLRCLAHTTTPTSLLNVAGLEQLSVRQLAQGFGKRFGVTPQIVGREAESALLSDAGESVRLFGPPRVPLSSMLDWTADWLQRGGESLGRPTKFEVRDGTF